MSGIDRYTFNDCESLTSVTIPQSVVSISEDAIDHSKGHCNVTIHAPAGSYAEQFAKKQGIPFEAL